ncbi:MAG TPA: GreA/GreB family elongation factor [Sumerlaeia bacterium]|nr:GreA/GreB family elongation factor [Sumerlaeia bacterium]
MATRNSRLENQILHFSKLKKWDKVGALWPQVVENPPENAGFYATVATRLVKADKAGDLRAWILLLAEACATLEQHRLLIRLCQGALHALPEFEELRPYLIDALRARYRRQPRLEEYLEESGLHHEAALSKPLNRFLQFISCSEGEVFRHGDWGEGKVVVLDPARERVTIAFLRHGEKSFSFSGVREFLQKIPRSHLLAQRVLEPKRLAERAESDPVEFARFCLAGLGGAATRGELKEALLEGVFDSRQWNSWWNRNRDRLRLDPYIGFSGPAGNPRMELRSEPKSFHEEMCSELARAQSFARRYVVVTDILRMHETEPVPAEVAAKILDRLRASLGLCDGKDVAQQIECLCLIEDLRTCLPDSCVAGPTDPDAREVLAGADDPVEVVCAVSTFEYQTRMADHLRQSAPERWPERAEEIFLNGPAHLGQWVLRELIEGGDPHAASHLAEQLLHRPYENPDLFLWLSRSIREGKWPDLEVDVPAEMLAWATLDLIEDCHLRLEREDGDSASIRGMKVRLGNLLMENHHAILREAFEPLDTEEARRRYAALMAHPALSESFKLSLDHALRALRRDLDETSGGAEGEGEFLVTAKAFEEKQKEYLKLKNEEIPANSRAIGQAAAQGDLTENAEYDAAKERQRVLFRRLESLEGLLQRARVLDPDRIRTDVISCGAAFEVRSMDTGTTERYQLLGLWDADPEKNVFSYLTPFGRQFLNHKVGDQLVVQRPGGATTQYQVLTITNALASAGQPA